MEKNIQVFENTEFGKVRTVVINDEPWFVGKDVTTALRYANASKALADHVDNEDKLNNDSLLSLGQRGGWLINESGLYSLILYSKLPTAKKFKRWVTSEVLPSIRKTGSYNLPDFTNPAEAARAWANEFEAKQKLLEENKVLKPKAEFYDTVANSESLLSMGHVAKALDMGIGRNKLFEFLRGNGILNSHNIPYQRFVNAGYFKLVESMYMAGDNQVVATTTYVKQKGVDYIRKLLLKEN